jgi:hypothetical protein
VVLVHGAWADGGSWNPVVLPLLLQALKVICAPIPLTSLSDNADVLNPVLERTDGPVLLHFRTEISRVRLKRWRPCPGDLMLLT